MIRAVAASTRASSWVVRNPPVALGATAATAACTSRSGRTAASAAAAAAYPRNCRRLRMSLAIASIFIATGYLDADMTAGTVSYLGCVEDDGGQQNRCWMQALTEDAREDLRQNLHQWEMGGLERERQDRCDQRRHRRGHGSDAGGNAWGCGARGRGSEGRLSFVVANEA